MKLKDPHDFRGGLNTDDAPSNLPPGDYTDALNIRALSSSEQHGAGVLESLQGEIELLINPEAAITYYGGSIGGQFVYEGYEEVTIGTQTWMKKNWDKNYPGSKVYDDNVDNASAYGRLYTHSQVMGSDFCPAGWHVPTEAEFDTLLTYLGGEMLAGGKLKEVGTNHWLTPNTDAEDSDGFKAVPGGKFDALFDLLGENGLLWLQDDAAPLAPVADDASVVEITNFTANWIASEGADGYYLDVAMDALFTSMAIGYDNLDVGNAVSYVISGLDSGTSYYYRVRAYNEIDTSSSSNTITLQTTQTVFNDWFLPSSSEATAMRTELYSHGVGGFDASVPYWSSTEVNSTNAYWKAMVSGTLGSDSKYVECNVRACRAFTSTTVYALRDVGPAGGLIFWKSGNDYLEAAPVDCSSSAWSNIINVAIGTTGTAIGTGQANTNAIIAQVGHTDSAAKLCDDLII